jgi:hypothetical protein
VQPKDLEELMMIAGGCLCGRVRYRIDGEALFSLHCHCRDCQRASGTGHVPVMGILRAALTVSGEPKSYATVGASKHKAIRHFCPDCGSLLFGEPEAVPHIMTIYAGSLDDPGVFKPREAQFTYARQPWDIGAEPLPEFPMAAPRPEI